MLKDSIPYTTRLLNLTKLLQNDKIKHINGTRSSINPKTSYINIPMELIFFKIGENIC